MPNTRNNPPVAETLLVDTLNTFKDNMEKMFNSGIEKMNKSMELLHEEVSEIRMELKMVSDLRNSVEFTQAELKETQEEIKLLNKSVKEKEKQNNLLENRLLQSEKMNNLLQEKILQLDVYSRRENLKFSGIPKTRTNLGLLLKRS